jgi:ketosteroid isomerase-like protein
MEHTNEAVEQFFDHYAAALLARDEKAISRMYAVPALIISPDQLIAVSDASQTEQFFASSWEQYEGVEEANPQITIMGQAPASIWADVSWSYSGRVQERFCYQLTRGTDGYQIAVLTPMT